MRGFPRAFSRALLYGTVATMVERRKDRHAVALGRKGGRKGGKARWEGVPPAERSEILRRAVMARWERAKKKG